MNGTPRLRSSYPSTPDHGRRSSPASHGSPSGEGGSRIITPVVPRTPSGLSSGNGPLIPLTVLDAPSQRFYVVAIYVALLAWRFYDWKTLLDDEAESFWLFIKWVAIDGVFLYGLPEMRIPWLEWSNPIITGIFLLHAVLNGILMFRIPIPIQAGLAALVKTLYDRELSISENRVKPANILHNSSLIMGRQIINILPEGSVTLNPNGGSFCIDDKRPWATLSIQLNQTEPLYIELLRIDFDTNTNETFTIKGKELQNLKKQGEKKRENDSDILVLQYPVRKTGVYRLGKVVEKSKLEVQRRMSDILVVACPRAAIQPTSKDRCIGDLSDLTVLVEGTPPLKIVYSRTINHKDESFHFQSLQPQNLVSPLLASPKASTLVSVGEEDVSWGRLQSITVRLNESMGVDGDWLYSIDEVHDAAGNVANFSLSGDDGERISPKGKHLEHAFVVHERPVAQLACDTRHPLRVASGVAIELPVKFTSSSGKRLHGPQGITWKFSPIDTLTPNGDHGDESIVEKHYLDSPRHLPSISRPGLYTLQTVLSEYCEGEIREPASCLLINPPKPDLSISAEDIYDKCADNSIGILVDLDLTGTPPFIVRYEIIQNRVVERQSVQIEGSRHQLELKPRDAGHFTYRFTTIDDAIYKGQPLIGSSFTLEQDVKPPASAFFVDFEPIAACIDEPIELKVLLSGEPPFALEYELVHEGKRKKRKITGIENSYYNIATDPLTRGGEYSMALASVQDKTGCKIFLNDEIKINVRRQRPKVSFAQIDGKRTIKTLEGKQVDLPLRLEGVGPWTITYRHLDDASGKILEAVKQKENDQLRVDQRGKYELVSVRDRQCPGTVDASAASFDISWISRPTIKVGGASGLTLEGNKFSKKEVCEGDVDSMEINLSGTPPYHLKYKQHLKPEHGSKSMSTKEIDAALGVITIAMETTKAGLHTYDFCELSDNAYDYESKKSSLLTVEQRVHPKPSAKFTKPGQSYKYCKEEEAGDEMIPITLYGLPPFYLEVDIKHQSNSRPETVKIRSIESNHYDFRIPHKFLSLGTHQVSVRKVQDARGCEQTIAYGAPHVQVQVYDVPTIYALETQKDYCVGDRISYTLSGTPPFDIYYTFGGITRKARTTNTNFRRIAEAPGNFTITEVSDKASECKAKVNITKTIHEMPSVKISKGRQVSVDIHEGGEADILFEFWGTPPFEFTYTRSTNARKGQKSQVLETRHEVSYEHSKIVQASQEGTYEVVAIKDNFCSFSTQMVGDAKGGQKLLKL